MTRVLRRFLLVELVAFAVAALVHGGLLLEGYAHQEAYFAEAAIATALLIGLIVTFVRPASARQAAVAAQGFALFWTLIGVLMIATGRGPQTTLDIVYHVAIVATLLWGLATARRSRVAPA
jgi:hypothetical protein